MHSAITPPTCSRSPSRGAGWESVIGAEPTLGTTVEGEALGAALAAIGEFSELKSPWFMGHAQHIAEPAGEAGKALGLRPDDGRRTPLRLRPGPGPFRDPEHDLGQAGMLTRQELERVRIHPYLSERMLSFSPPLAPLGDVAVQHHERLDGSGYPRRLSGEAVSPMARILAAADVYAAVTAPRPQRAAMSTADAASELMREVTGGRLDGDAARAVLRAAGQQVGRRWEWPASLTSREIEILRLLARGMSNKEIAAVLVISPKTAGTHIEHIYGKIHASNRAQASVFALKHGLMPDLQAPR
jgi:DNA-binding CsgD family transcriptional regulator